MTYTTISLVKTTAMIGYSDLGFSSDADYENYISSVIEMVEGEIDSYCNRQRGFFGAGGVAITDELYDFPEDGIIFLNNYPVLSITKVELNKAGWGAADDWQEISSTDYVIIKKRGVLKLLEYPGREEESVRVSYVAGYESTPLPVKYVATQASVNFLHGVLQRKISPVARVDEFTIKLVLPEAFTQDLYRKLDPYKRGAVIIG